MTKRRRRLAVRGTVLGAATAFCGLLAAACSPGDVEEGAVAAERPHPVEEPSTPAFEPPDEVDPLERQQKAAAAAEKKAAAERTAQATRLVEALSNGSAATSRGAQWRLGTDGLPKNSRQTAEGYWVGAHPDPEHLRELHARGVRVIVSGTRLTRAQREVCDELGLEHVNLPFGGRFPNQDTLFDGVAQADSSEVYIHCEHGGDRSGAMLAFFLTTRDRWPVGRALLSVVYPPHRDRLVALLAEEGVEIEASDVHAYTGIYSPELNGGFGGLKVNGDSYVKLVRTTLAAIGARQAMRRP